MYKTAQTDNYYLSYINGETVVEARNRRSIHDTQVVVVDGVNGLVAAALLDLGQVELDYVCFNLFEHGKLCLFGGKKTVKVFTI